MSSSDYDEESGLMIGFKTKVGKQDFDTDYKKTGFNVADTDTLGSSNIGFKMLQKFGWKGSGLGKSEQGITVPVMVAQSDSTLGIGKAAEYENVISEVTRDRKKMDVEIDQTVEIIQRKRETADRQDFLETDLKRVTQEFYCESCDKRYKNVSEMSNHLSSYDHHHKKRFKEMKDVARKRKAGFAIGESDEVRIGDIRRKEERREAKEMESRINKAKALQQPTVDTQAATPSSTSSSLLRPSSKAVPVLSQGMPPPPPPSRLPACPPPPTFALPHAPSPLPPSQLLSAAPALSSAHTAPIPPHTHSLIPPTQKSKFSDINIPSVLTEATGLLCDAHHPPVAAKPVVMKFNFSIKKK